MEVKVGRYCAKATKLLSTVTPGCAVSKPLTILSHQAVHLTIDSVQCMTCKVIFCCERAGATERKRESVNKRTDNLRSFGCKSSHAKRSCTAILCRLAR